VNAESLYNLFRLEVRDLATPYLWSEAEIYAYMDDAQSMFCRLYGGIADSTSAATTVTATAGAEFAAISPKILKLRHARLAADGQELKLLNFEDLQLGSSGGRDDYGQQAAFKFDNTEGPIRAIVLGMEPNSVRLVNIPQTTQTIRLIVYRMPLLTLAANATPMELEIDEQHHRHLLNWMKALAYEKQDSETYDRGKSVEFGEKFRAYCDKAKAERERSEHKYRATTYGGL